MERQIELSGIMISFKDGAPLLGRQVISLVDGEKIVDRVENTLFMLAEDFSDEMLTYINKKLSTVGFTLSKIEEQEVGDNATK